LWKIVREVLDEYGIPYDEVWVETGKPIADYYIDDRGVYFSDWDQVLKSIGILESFTRQEKKMKKDKFILKDSGKRDEFNTGMVRDARVGKGRFDLFSPFALQRIAMIFEKGAIKYEDRNWEKGSPFSRTLDSAIRHIMQYMMGMEDEDHLAQAAWNIMAIMHLQKTMPELDDMPHYLKEK
jgi:hypothetical protein